jgi:hypothetical protein
MVGSYQNNQFSISFFSDTDKNGVIDWEEFLFAISGWLKEDIVAKTSIHLLGKEMTPEEVRSSEREREREKNEVVLLSFIHFHFSFLLRNVWIPIQTFEAFFYNLKPIQILPPFEKRFKVTPSSSTPMVSIL